MNIDIRGIERGDEIGQMARSVVVFRNNAIELAASQRSFAHQASMLEEKLAQERRLAQLQSNFVSMASHEFRTPLTIRWTTSRARPDGGYNPAARSTLGTRSWSVAPGARRRASCA
jgi:signal transduction histidine kinase